jgi:type II secretory pathway component PulF
MKTMFTDFGMPLPEPTMWTIYASDAVLFVLPYWPWILLVIALVAGAIYGLRYVPGREFRTRLWQRIPLIGATARSVGLSEFCSLLGLMVENRVPLPEGLRLTATALRDPNLVQGSRMLADQVERGIAPYDEVQRMPQFARSLAPVFRWTDRPDALSDGLRAAAELYAMQARVQSGVVGAVMQPIMLAMIILLAGGMFVSLFAPIISLLDALS